MYFCCKQNKNVIVNRNIILTIKLKTKQMELLGIIGPFQILIFLTIIFFTAVLPILAIIDILRSEFAGNNKIMWFDRLVYEHHRINSLFFNRKGSENLTDLPKSIRNLQKRMSNLN